MPLGLLNVALEAAPLAKPVGQPPLSQPANTDTTPAVMARILWLSVSATYTVAPDGDTAMAPGLLNDALEAAPSVEPNGHGPLSSPCPTSVPS